MNFEPTDYIIIQSYNNLDDIEIIPVVRFSNYTGNIEPNNDNCILYTKQEFELCEEYDWSVCNGSVEFQGSPIYRNNCRIWLKKA